MTYFKNLILFVIMILFIYLEPALSYSHDLFIADSVPISQYRFIELLFKTNYINIEKSDLLYAHYSNLHIIRLKDNRYCDKSHCLTFFYIRNNDTIQFTIANATDKFIVGDMPSNDVAGTENIVNIDEKYGWLFAVKFSEAQLSLVTVQNQVGN